MDAKQFLAEFGHIVNAPGGVQQLRELVLQFAVQGRLFAERQSRTLYILGDVGKWGSGGTPPKTHADYYGGDIPWLVIGDLNDGIVTSASGSITQKGLENSSAKLIPPGALLVGMYGSIGKLGITGFECATNQAIAHCVVNEDLALTRYLFVFIRANRSHLFLQGKGLAQQNISQTILKAQKIELPPIEEQARIVAKVDELMALCDKLEAQQQKRRKLQTLTRTTALDVLANAQSPHELKEAWLRVQENMPLLLDGSDDVVDFKQALRELAIIGHLSKRTEEDVENYLRQLSKFKSVKRTAKLKEVESDIVLPKGWRWVLLEDLIYSSDSGWSPKCNPTPREKGEWGVLKVSAVTWGKFKSEENKALPLNLKARPEHEVKPFDFMLSRANTAELVAKSVIAPVDVPEKLMMSDKIIRLNFIDDDLKPWVNLVNNSKISRKYYKHNATGTSDSMRNVSRKVIHELAVPLPPKSEQEKILEKLKYLDLYCDRLEKQFTKANKIAKNLAQAAIASITGTEIKEDQKMKVPKTELVSKLKLKVSPNNKDQAPLSAILAKHNGELSSKALWNYSDMDIDKFYQQLKIEMARDWIVEPEKARMIEKDADNQSGAEAG
jgi:type I restriction enzyme S subunit